MQPDVQSSGPIACGSDAPSPEVALSRLSPLIADTVFVSEELLPRARRATLISRHIHARQPRVPMSLGRACFLHYVHGTPHLLRINLRYKPRRNRPAVKQYLCHQVQTLKTLRIQTLGFLRSLVFPLLPLPADESVHCRWQCPVQWRVPFGIALLPNSLFPRPILVL